MTVLTGNLRERERALILGGDFPYHPILPVVRRSEADTECGLLVWRYVPTGEERTAGPWRVYLGNLVEVGLRAKAAGRPMTWKEALDGCQMISYDDLDAFFDDGWRGD